MWAKSIWVAALTVAVLGSLPARAQFELTPLACSQEQSLRATADTTPATIRFVNATADAIRVYRLDTNGRRVLDADIAPSGTLAKSSSPAEPWVVTDRSGQCRAVYLPIPGEAVARIAALSIVLPQTGVIFKAVAGGPAPPPQSFHIVNGGTGLMRWMISVPMMTGTMTRGWLRLSPVSGTSDAAQPPPRVEASVDPMGLDPGEYCNLVEVTAPGAVNSPQNFCVVLLVLAGDADVGPTVDQTGLAFAVPAGGGNPASQSVEVYNLSKRQQVLTSESSFSGGGNWFTAQVSGVTLALGGSVTVNVQPNLAGLAPGVYKGELTLRFGMGAPAAKVAVQAVVPASGGGMKPARARAASCSPTKLLPVFTVLGSNFNCQAGWPIPIEVVVVDDCGDGMTAGSVEASFSNNDPPLNLTPLPNARWSGTWPPRNARPAGMTITVLARRPDLKIEGAAQITGGLDPASDVPVVAVGGIVNAVNFAATPPGPGSYVAIFGERLSEGTAAASQLPLLLRMQGTEVFVSGRTIPLLFTSTGQVNAMLPYGIAVNGRHQLIVRRGHCMSVPEAIEVAPAQPSIFSVDGSGKGQGHIHRVTAAGDAILAAPGSPAAAGEAIVIYSAGLGAVDPAVEAGSAASAAVLSKTVNPVTVTIGGKQATVHFGGLVPGFAGFYQVNATVPEGIPADGQTPVTLTVAGQSSPSVWMAVR